MAETQKASVGYMGEVWLHNSTLLYELREVKGFGIPTLGEREQVETTHLKSPEWRRTYTSTFYEDSDFDVMLNFRPLSDTDVLLADALADGDVRAMKVVLPENGVPTAQIELTVRCINYSRGEVAPNDVMEATATFRVVTMDLIEAYVA
jgi:Lambda phage tail tube protein, TTP